MGIDLARFHRTFFEESFEGADAMEHGLLGIEPEQGLDSEAVNAVFRAAHSIKGGAATFGFTAVSEFTHRMETLLDEVRSGTRPLGRPAVDLLLRAVDVVRALLAGARDGTAVDADTVARVRGELDALLGGHEAKPAVPQVPAELPAVAGWRIRFVPRPELFRSGNDPLLILRELDGLGALEPELVESALPCLPDADPEACFLSWNLVLRTEASHAQVLDAFAWVQDECELDVLPLSAPAVAAPPPTLQLVRRAESAPPGGAVERAAEGGSIRVSTEKIDLLINLVGELVITQAMLAQHAGQLDPVVNEKLLAGLSQLDRNTRQLQEAVMGTRMLPIDSVFSRFPRLVRDLATKLGKQVRLVTVGESTELDKSVIEKISDPLNHLVRNSLDHGIELPAQRIQKGKDPVGMVRLTAAHQGGHIVIEVVDDGRGLQREQILAKAREKGIACADTMSDAEVWQLIFAPGFSTAEQVTDVSGRGVGMDVVKRNIQSLGGTVELTSEPGGGTRTVIRLPLTLAILDGMSVRVGQEVFILPLNSVVESLQPTREQVKSISNHGRVVRVRNEFVPLLPLYELFGITSEVQDPHRGILVLLEAEGRKLALQVDDLVGQQQVVIKSIETNYKRVHCVSGATILGDGRVALILDVAELVRVNHRAAA